MKIYYAGLYENVAEIYTLKDCGAKRLMLSYYYKNKEKQMIRFKENNFSIMMDSGAYSAWKKNIKIDINDYVKYLNDFEIKDCICLDVVGDAISSYKNQKYLENKGINSIPVFHYGCEFKYLEQLILDGYSYICLGGTVGLKRKERREFFETCFRLYPEIKFHGLGMTDIELMKDFDWYSVDSTTWLIGRKYSKLATLEGQVKISNKLPVQERIAMNVKFFVELERIKNHIK